MENDEIEQLKDNIREYIKQNGNKEITGQILQDVLLGMVDGLVGNDAVANPTDEATETMVKIKIGETIYGIPQTNLPKGLLYGGEVYPDTVITPDIHCYYIANGSGNYISFGNALVGPAERICYLYYDESNEQWDYSEFDTYKYSYAHSKFEQLTDLSTSTIQVSSAQEFTNAERLQALANVSNQEAGYNDSTPPVFTGKMGYVVLQPQDDEDLEHTSFAAQIANKPNTIFEIMDVYDLGVATVSIPNNCVLKFNGGMLKNGEITTNNCFISSDKKCFDDTIIFSSGSKIANVSSKLSWFCDNNGSADYGLVNAGAISNDVFVDLEKVTLSHPITYTVSKRIRGLVGKQTTSLIIATNDFSQGNAIANALIIFDVNLDTNDGIFDLALDGNFKAKYGFFSYKYVSKVQRCQFRYFVLSAIYIGGSEDSDIAYNHISYCGCGVYATSYAVPDNNLVKFPQSPGQGSLTELRIHHNYIVFTNYGIIANVVGVCSEIKNNCISESSCYASVLNTNRNVVFNSNYIESSGLSCFWIEEGITWQELYNNQLKPVFEGGTIVECDHLKQSHEDIFGLTMTGWGIPFTRGGVDIKIRPSVIIWTNKNIVSVCNNGWSTNHCRTKPSDVTVVNNDDNAIGIDSILCVGGLSGIVEVANNRINYTVGGVTTVTKYLVTGMNKTVFGSELLNMPKLVLGENIGDFNKKEYVYNVPALGSSRYSIYMESVANSAKIRDNGINLVNNCGPYTNYPRANQATFNALSKNIYNMAVSDTMIIENVPMFMLPKVGGYNLTARGVDFLLQNPGFNFTIGIRIYNDESDAKIVRLNVRNLNESANPDNLITLSVLTVPAKDYIDVSTVVGYIDLHDYCVVSIVDSESASGSQPPASYPDIYISVPYITPVDGNIQLDLSSDRTNSYGVLTKGATAERPIGLSQGFKYYDTDMQKEIVFNGIDWTNVDGSSLAIYTIDKSFVASGVIVENTATTVERGSTYITRVSSPTGLKVSDITVKMGGIDISSIAYLESQEIIYIGNVTGNIVIEGGTLSPNYLTFEALEANSTIKMQADVDAPSISLEYSPNDGATWLPFVVGTTTVTLANIGDKAMFRGTNSKTSVLVSGTSKVNTFVMTGTIAASGCVTSILNGVGGTFDFSDNGALNNLFKDCSSLVSAPSLPFGVVTANAFSEMFKGCTNIEGNIYVKSSSVLSNAASFNSMFYGCGKVTSFVFDNINKSAYTFYNNNSCVSFVIKQTTPAELLNTGLIGLPKSTCTIYVPYSSDHSVLNAYKTTGEWKNWYDAAMLTERTTEAIQELDENGDIPT
jgi:hypothetical protein